MVANLNAQWPTAFLSRIEVLWAGVPFVLIPDSDVPDRVQSQFPDIEDLDDPYDPTWEWCWIVSHDSLEYHLVETASLESVVPLRPCGHPETSACYTEEDGSFEHECQEA